MSEIGFGCNHYELAFYVEHRPNESHYGNVQSLMALPSGAISEIGTLCGNGWRKQFNVYAKFIYSLDRESCNLKAATTSWQHLRDSLLLQQGSKTALLFTPPDLSKHHAIHIIAGRTYAKKLINENKLNCQLIWLNTEFAYDASHNLIVSPFLDYRQLSNIKIDYLAQIYTQLRKNHAIDPLHFVMPTL